jgi:hypothetical protein
MTIRRAIGIILIVILIFIVVGLLVSAITSGGSEAVAQDTVTQEKARWVKKCRETIFNIRWPGGRVHFNTCRRWKTGGHQILEARPTRMSCWVTGYTGGWRCGGFNRRWDRKWFAWDGWWLGGYSQKSSYRIEQCTGIDPLPGEWCARQFYHDVKLISHAHRPWARIKILG